MEKLYKKDSKGKIIEWSAFIKRELGGINIQIEYGEYDGKKIIELRTGIKGKNINKSNETSPFQQATIEIEALYKKKKRGGYKSLSDLKFVDDPFSPNVNIYDFLVKNLSIHTTDLDGVVKPMKAQQYYRSKKNWTAPDGTVWEDRKYFYLKNPHVPKERNSIIIKFPCLAQPKINGARALVREVDGKAVITSKDGLEYNLPHISEWFEQRLHVFKLLTENGKEIDIIFDGELYIYGENLQTISSALKLANFNTPRLKFICFDLAIEDRKNLDRILTMKNILKDTTLNLDSPVEYITTSKIGNDETAQRKTDEYIAAGYEGAIFRDMNNIYGFGKRPMTMVKLKRCMDAEFKIVDIIPQDINPNLGLFVCRTKDGKEFRVTPHMNESEKEALLFTKHLYINKMLTCSFYEYTEDNKPLHVINSVIRDYE